MDKAGLIAAYERAIDSPAKRMDLIEGLIANQHDISALGLESYLVEVLRADPNPIVRHEAAFVLGRLKDCGQIGGDVAVSALCIAACEDPSLVVRHEAVEALACFEHDEASSVLVNLLYHDHSDIRATASISLERRNELPSPECPA